MRVIAGEARGRRLTAPTGTQTRPTSDAVREAVFGAVCSRMDLEGVHALDLFAGSGALGVEALSRGASEVTFVDQDRRAVSAVEANLAATKLTGGRAIRASVLPWLAGRGADEPWLLVFADPPYTFVEWSSLLFHLAAHVPEGGLVVMESDREIETPEGWQTARAKRYGATVVTIAIRQPAEGCEGRIGSLKRDDQ